MERKPLLSILCAIISCASAWNNLNCPAPRAPDNGLSFIFRNGELIRFRCHPGYMMLGKAIAHCVNNVWTHPAPFCVPIRGNIQEFGKELYQSRVQNTSQDNRPLFNWSDKIPKHGVYGDGARRLPLINGIWPPVNHSEQVLALGPQSTPGPKTMVKEEIDIAELRVKQLEELRKQRHKDREHRGRKRKAHSKRNKQKNSVLVDDSAARKTILALGITGDGQALSVAHAKPEKGRRKQRTRANRKHKRKMYPGYVGDPNFITSRTSRVDTSGVSLNDTRHSKGVANTNVAELRRRPIEEVQAEDPFWSYDTSCVDVVYGRSVPKIAPQLEHSFVFRYETKKNTNYPFNAYMEVKYRCLSRYHFVDPSTQTLFCKKGKWVGDMPKCIEDAITT